MRLSLIGVTAAAAIAMAVIAAPSTPGATAAAEPRASVPTSPAQTVAAATAVAPHRSATIQYYVDLNSATKKELMTLPGVGAADATRIIANRPYLTKTELVTKNVLPIGPFLSVRNLVVAMPRTAAKGRS